MTGRRASETPFEELKRYVRFNDADAGALLAFRPFAEPHFTRITEEFYARIREHGDAHAVFTGEEQIQRLQRSMVRWMDRLLSGTYDEAYREQTSAIGRMHVRVGLPQRYMFTAMALIRVAFEEVAEKELGARAAATRTALTRLLDLELSIMLESYRVDLAVKARRRDEIEAEGLRTDLARALRLYVTAIDVTPSLIVGVDAQGTIRLFNRAASMLTGHALEDVFGASFVEILAPEEERVSYQQLIDSLLQGPPIELDRDCMVKIRSGNLREVHWRFSRIASEAPGDIVLFAVGSDVTDSRVAAQQAQRQERLAALGTLAAGLAHEIRNPLNGAQLHVAFLQRELAKKTNEPDMTDAAGVVAEEIKRLARLVTEFLDFARPSVLNWRPVTLQHVVARVLDLNAAEAKNRGIALTRDLPSGDLVLSADAEKLEQVLLNIVQNAFDALGTSTGGKVVVRARRYPRHVLIEVEDNGPGLPSEEAPVFDAFFSTKPNGTGLGLAITHRIVTDHGGTVDVESKPGLTRFRFTIPIGEESP